MNLIAAVKEAREWASESSDNSTIEHDSRPSVSDLIERLEEDFAEEIARAERWKADFNQLGADVELPITNWLPPVSTSRPNARSPAKTWILIKRSKLAASM